MKRLILYAVILCALIGLFISLGIAKDNPPGPSDEKMEKLIDETIKDIGQMVNQPAKPEPEQETKAVSPAEKKEPQELMELEFNQANLEDVLRMVAETSGQNIVLDPMLKGKKIDLHLKKTNTDEVLELLYNAYGLGSLNIGNILFVSTREKIKQGTTKTKIVELKNINIDDAKALISNMVTTINMSKETNTLVLIGAPEDIEKAEKILKEVDVPQPQVLLEAKIIEINDDALREIGIDYSDSITVDFQETARITTLPTTATAAAGFFHIYKFARSAVQFETILKMLEQQDKARVLSSPRVTTMNNKEAEIFIGDRVPYTITTVTGGVASTEVRFVEPGIRLKITPSIVQEDFVVIKIEPEVSYIYSWRGTADQYPWVKARQATAYVRIKNGQPFAMGGLISKEDKKNLYSIPFLGRIPILGRLFTYEKKTDKNTDLIITVIPTILSGKN